MSLTESMLLEDIRQRLFSPTRSVTPRAVGAELELIPVDGATRAVVAARDGSRSSAAILSRLGAREGWVEQASEGDPPSWNLPDGARVSFEPGGQIEISSSPHETASSLIRALQRLAATLEEAMTAEGVALIARGVDPYNDVAAVPLQLKRDRYTRMTHYFNSLGPFGIRMMRQTAALQINVERGSDPLSRWRLLNALAPVIVALFANSRRYAGADTGFASYRAHVWRSLDPSRTGLAYDGSDPAAGYLGFALNAMAIRSAEEGKPKSYRTFRDWMLSGETTDDDWQFHLSTLFPEVRPKAYFELRSADTVDVRSLAAPIVFVTGLIYDPDAARDATGLLGPPSEQLLERAGRLALRDRELRELASELVELSVRGSEALGTNYVASEDIGVAREYFARALDGN